MWKYTLYLFFSTIISSHVLSSNAPSEDIQSAVNFMQNLGDKVSDIVRQKTGDEKRSSLKEIFEHDVHHKSIAQFVLGRLRRDLKAALAEAKDDLEKESIKKRIQDALDEFYKAYKKSIIRTYLSSFENGYKGGIFKATHGRKSGEDGVTVYSTLDRQNGTPPLNLHWVLKPICADDAHQCSPDNKHWKVVDLRVENVSQAQKEKDETESIISKHRGNCTQGVRRLCAVVALEKLTEEHKRLNRAWKEKGSISTTSPSSKTAA